MLVRQRHDQQRYNSSRHSAYGGPKGSAPELEQPHLITIHHGLDLASAVGTSRAVEDGRTLVLASGDGGF